MTIVILITFSYQVTAYLISLKKHVLIAPFNGSFMQVTMEVGAVANPGATLAKIIRTDRLELEVPVTTTDADWVSIGDNVDVMTKDGSVHWQGKVIRKSDFIDVNTQRLNVFVSLIPTKDKPLYAGEYLKAIFAGRKIDNVMEIPRNAVSNYDEVFIIKDAKLVRIKINVHKVNEKTIVFSGPEEGTELVVEPLVSAMENTRVEIMR